MSAMYICHLVDKYESSRIVEKELDSNALLLGITCLRTKSFERRLHSRLISGGYSANFSGYCIHDVGKHNKVNGGARCSCELRGAMIDLLVLRYSVDDRIR